MQLIHTRCGIECKDEGYLLQRYESLRETSEGALEEEAVGASFPGITFEACFSDIIEDQNYNR